MQRSSVDVIAACLFSWIHKPDSSDEYSIALILFLSFANILPFLDSDNRILISDRGE